jgi:SH3-like domain-containing protein
MRSASVAVALVLGVCAALFPSAGGALAGRQGQTSAGAVTTCDVEAYVNDPDPKGMNVRSGPGGSYKVIGNLPNQDVDGIGVHITGSSGDWVRIDRADQQGADEERILFKGVGWVYGPLLGVDGVGGLEGGTRLYSEPSRRGRVLARMQAGGEGGTVRGCRGKWMYVEHKKLKGWAAPDTICSNALTTCS